MQNIKYAAALSRQTNWNFHTSLISSVPVSKIEGQSVMIMNTKRELLPGVAMLSDWEEGNSGIYL